MGKEQVIRDAPCPYCAVWVGPHKHFIRDSGEIGPLVMRLEKDDGKETIDELAARWAEQTFDQEYPLATQRKAAANLILQAFLMLGVKPTAKIPKQRSEAVADGINNPQSRFWIPRAGTRARRARWAKKK